jgi:hypothetical protein
VFSSMGTALVQTSPPGLVSGALRFMPCGAASLMAQEFSYDGGGALCPPHSEPTTRTLAL